MRLIIADPPYLGRAATWYGGKGRGTTSTPGRARGRGTDARESHPDAARWDDPIEHVKLMGRLECDSDGWALAASAKTLPLICPGIPRRARIAVWQVTNAIPDGARVRSTWEAVIYRIPDARRDRLTGMSVSDVLRAPAPRAGFVGAKPEAWVSWVLELLGWQPGDVVEDLFPGSGAVSAVTEGRLL